MISKVDDRTMEQPTLLAIHIKLLEFQTTPWQFRSNLGFYVCELSCWTAVIMNQCLTLRASRRCPVSYLTLTLRFLSQVNQLPKAPPPVVTAIEAKAEPDALHTQDSWYPGDSGILQIPATQSHSHSDSHIDQNITLGDTNTHISTTLEQCTSHNSQLHRWGTYIVSLR